MTQIINQMPLPNEVPEQSSALLKLCSNCNKSNQQTELLRCSKCKKVYYCGTDCQKKDWPLHKKVCGKDQQKIEDKQPIKQTKQTKQTTKPKKQKQDGLNQFGKLIHIGTGNFSIVYKTVSKKDGKTYAIKQIEKSKVQRMRKEADVLMEKHCLNKLKDCEHVVRLYKTFQDQISLYFQMEFPEKGELWETSKIFGVLPNSVYKYYASHIIQAVSVLHNQYQIVHRDLKPENILLDAQNRIKLIDFGTAKDLDRPDIKGAGNGIKGKKQFEHYVGTAHYMAPECIHNRASQKKSDIYSLSGILYFLKVGSPPFQGGSQYLTFTKSLEKPLLTCPELFDPKLQDLIKKMNCKEMQDRIDINEVITHPYFQGVDFCNLPSYQESMSKITDRQRFLQTLCKKLQQTMQGYKQPPLQKRKQIYQNQIEPILKKQIGQAQVHLRQRLQIIDIQCQCFLNIRDNNNISFTEIYQEVRGIRVKDAEVVVGDCDGKQGDGGVEGSEEEMEEKEKEKDHGNEGQQKIKEKEEQQ